MSTESIVNRVHQTPHYQLEGEKLLAETKPVVEQVAENPVVQEQLAEQGLQIDEDALKQPGPEVPAHTEYAVPYSADGVYHVADHVGDTVKILPPTEAIEEDPEDNIGNLASASDSFDPRAALYGILGMDAEFKKQVISAFKHLGLDTRKHFGV
jgi:hypothetical protein